MAIPAAADGHRGVAKMAHRGLVVAARARLKGDQLLHRLRNSIGTRGAIALGVVVVGLLVGAGLLLASGGDDEPVEQAAAPAVETPAPDPEPKDTSRPRSDEKSGSKGADKPAAPPAGEPEAQASSELDAFQDCVADNGGKPIDLSQSGEAGASPLEGYTPEELKDLQEARMQCVGELPAEAREEARQRMRALAESPFRSCIVAEQAGGSDLRAAFKACRDELSAEEQEQLPRGVFGAGSKR